MKKCGNIKPDNRGAAMITVVIAILFIVALGVALLSVSYLGYAVTLSQKTGKDNFYDAARVMDDIRAGVHDDASDALANAYTETLKNHASKLKSDPAYDPQKTFSESFAAELKNRPLLPENGDGTYSAKALYGMITLPAGCTVTVLGYSGGDGESDRSGIVSVQTGADAKGTAVCTALTLKDVAVKCKNAQNYETTVTSDITIKVPDFNVVASVPHSLKEFSVVADRSLDKNTAGGISKIAGNVYAGAVNVSDGGNELRFTSGDLLTRGDITVSDSAKLSFGDAGDGALSTRELWAKGIRLDGPSGAFETRGGKTYVANDLSVTGPGCSVTLAGEYTGFGGDTAGTADADKDNSSSILIGGKNTTLRIDSLSRLTLAGVSFIDVAGQPNSAAVPMGQSVAVKSDQLAYLAPVACLGSGYPTNPYAYSGDAAPALTVYTDTPLWPNTKITNARGEALNTKTITDYLGNPLAKGSVRFEKGEVSVRYSQSHIACVFLNFRNQSAANAYFKDYCTANAQNVAQYLQYYLNGETLAFGGKVSSAGNTYRYQNGILSPNDAAAGVSAQGPFDLYKDKSVSPYGSFVKNEPAIEDTYPFKSGGNVVAIVTNADYTYDSHSPANLQVIVSTGDVTINADFSGVVIAKGTVTVNRSIGIREGEAWVPASIDWQALLNATTGGGKKLSDFLGNGSASTGSGANKWDIGDLVVYENWRKS